jgi:hypothetical protein
MEMVRRSSPFFSVSGSVQIPIPPHQQPFAGIVFRQIVASRVSLLLHLNLLVMDVRSLSNDQLRRELKEANEVYTRHFTRIPAHAWQYEPYKSIRDKLMTLRLELARRKELEH